MKTKDIIEKLGENKLANIILSLGIVVLITAVFTLIYEMSTFKAESVDASRNYVHMDEIFLNASPLFKFTNQTNIFLGITIVLVGAKMHQKSRWQFDLLFIANVLITITFIIYWALISWRRADQWVTAPFKSFLSVLVHAINPIIGFVVMFLVRKNIIVKWKSISYASLYVLAYFAFGLVLFFISKATTTAAKPAVIYSFLNFTNPLFYKGGNLAVVIILDIFMFVIATLITTAFAFFWKAVYKMDAQKLNWKFKLKR
ncbi:hypothetical protein NV226_01285 [Mycoplasma iguanae]|uniref:Uncharacterized protein n=1 Tax=Mycoplasma iguanae TaxID=292461 RepID=A0ABY5RAZ4_9MOLU|nr:hypothetical protein [Mycoplasma iguanae]UVD81922.1 hypothetical protein NV226_01285 [Mycoplasma iguanae]